VHVVTEVEHY
jgi:hypothetical protein